MMNKGGFMKDNEQGFDQSHPEQVLKRRRYGAVHRIKPGLAELKNQVCDEANIPNDNKTGHYLTRMQMIELLTYLKSLKQLLESKGNEPKD